MTASSQLPTLHYSGKAVILLVDDVPETIDILNNTLRSDYRVKVATTGERALEIMGSDDPPDLVLLDIMMPGADGYEICRAAKSNIITRNIPIIFVTVMTDTEDEAKGFEVGAVDYITKPISPPIVRARVRTHLDLYRTNRLLDSKVRQRTRQLEATQLQIIQRLGRAAEYKDNETGLHVIRMSQYARLIALAGGIGTEEADLMLNAAPMHDVGKIGVPDHILLKPGKLDKSEWDVIRQHPAIGAGIIGQHDSPLLQMAREVALNHHEKWDGTGYPGGKAAENIPAVSRIVAVADVFDALTTERPYKHAWPVEEAVDYIRDGSEKHFDPNYVDIFVDILPEILAIKERYAEGKAPQSGMTPPQQVPHGKIHAPSINGPR